MAGIGFTLRKLTSRGDLLSQGQACLHAAISTSGGWLLTIVALAIVGRLGASSARVDEVITFRLIVVNNFAFSLVLTGPLTMVLTRYLADQIFARTVAGVPGMVIGGLIIALGVSLPLAVPYYVWYLDLPPGTTVAAVLGFGLVTIIWVVGVFLSTLKEYGAVTRAFGVGLVIAVFGVWVVGPDAGAGAMLAAFNVGLGYIGFTLIGRLFAEFPFAVHRPFAFLPYFRTKWPLAASGAAYYLGIWVDKWVMWVGPDRVTLPSGLVSYPDYDSALFLACLSVVPAMAVFVVHLETRFFEVYHRFYGEIGAHASLDRIRDNHEALVDVLRTGARQLIAPQIVLAIGLMLLAPVLFSALDIPYGQLGIFRIATLGAVFQLFFLLLTIVLSYLDLTRVALRLHVLFFAVNGLATAVTLHLGFQYYGYGYFLAAVVAFAAASVATLRSLDDLTYHAFVTGNTSLR